MITYGAYNISFNNEHVIYEQTIKCKVKDYEYNLSYNPTLIQSGSLTNLVSFATSGSFSPYATTIGLYNDSNDLLAVGKFSNPLPMTDYTDKIIIVKFDK